MPSAVLFWNDVALDANKEDHSHATREAGGPVYSARALALAHAAMADAYAGAHAAGGGATPFAPQFSVQVPAGAALPAAALGGAAHTVLSAIHSWQRPTFDARRDAFLASLAGENAAAVQGGWAFGVLIAQAILAAQATDGSADPTNGNAASGYRPGGLNGLHAPDPLNPGQGFHAWHYGRVRPLVLAAHEVMEMMPEAPPRTYETRYLDDYAEVLDKGRKAGGTRTAHETNVGIFWAYDGVNRIGTPPRLYNQAVRQIAATEATPLTETEWVVLLARVNIALSDAGIVAWQAKYLYNVWRPIVGIREHIVVPARPDAPRDAAWEPLGSPNSNGGGKDFTPPFPAYPSGHATFGAACFTVLQRFRRDRLPNGADADAIAPIQLASDELNGDTTAGDGVTERPPVTLQYSSIEAMIDDNLASRVFLGVHWRFDGDGGKRSGTKVGRRVAQAIYQIT